MKTNEYHDTVPELPENLEKFEAKALKQREKIVSFFKENAGHKFTPAEVYQACYPDSNVPLTSVRRAITNLTNDNVLIKTDEIKKGLYGRNNCKWFYPLRATQQKLF